MDACHLSRRTACLGGVSLLVLVVLGACQPKEAVRSLRARQSADTLSDAALKTHGNYISAVRAGAEKLQEEIPPQYWTAAIRALDPIKVYLHRVNVVVVQRVRDGIEEGKYICIMSSSFMPRTGDDGFEFTPALADDARRIVLDFKRARTPTTAGSSSAETTGSTFGIYLADTGDLLLSDQDIAAYVRASHEIKLNQSGIA
jgi:hypothetical protein